MKEDIKVSEAEASAIEIQTRKQSHSSKWLSERELRLTASRFGEICTIGPNRDMELLCKSIHTPPDLSRVPAVRHGQTYESVALEKFSEVTGKKVTKSGLCINPHYPFLGASPDGFVEGEDALVECKCPYNGRKSKIDAGKHFSFLERNEEGNLRLKRDNKYYYQVIGQLKLARRSHAYFIVYTHVDFFYEKIPMDEVFFAANMIPKLETFYNQYFCPYVASVLKQ